MSLLDNAAHRRALVASAVLAACFLGCGPLGPLPGGRLSGEPGSWPEDWESVAGVEQVQLETRREDPHSVNVWLVAVDGVAYLATSLLRGPEVPDEREWVRNIDADPRVRVRVDGVLYPARLQVVDDEASKERVFAAFLAKYPELDPSRRGGARFFRIARGDGSDS